MTSCDLCRMTFSIRAGKPRDTVFILMMNQKSKTSLLKEERQNKRRQKDHRQHASRAKTKVAQEKKMERRLTQENVVQKPHYTKGNLVQAKTTKEVMSAWDM